MPKAKQEYVEREADKDGTPFERFEKALKKIMHAPKPPPAQKKPREA